MKQWLRETGIHQGQWNKKKNEMSCEKIRELFGLAASPAAEDECFKKFIELKLQLQMFERNQRRYKKNLKRKRQSTDHSSAVVDELVEGPESEGGQDLELDHEEICGPIFKRSLSIRSYTKVKRSPVDVE